MAENYHTRWLASIARQQLRERRRYDPMPRRRPYVCPVCAPKGRTHKEGRQCPT